MLTRFALARQLVWIPTLLLGAPLAPSGDLQPLAPGISFSNQTAASGIAVNFDSGGGYSHWNYTGGGCAGDFNRDGFQDLFVMTGNGRDKLYINNGNRTFTDRALDWNLTAEHKGKGCSIGDFNRDGWLDIYVTSAGATGSVGPCHHKLYRNNGNGTFTDVAVAAGVNCTAPAVEDSFGAAFGVKRSKVNGLRSSVASSGLSSRLATPSVRSRKSRPSSA
jgi:hypothetical protein